MTRNDGTMKFAVIGSKNFNDYDFMKNILKWHEIKRIISGAARGADSLARRYALEFNIALEEYPAEWDKYGKKAAYLRDKIIIDKSDAVIAFFDVDSRGTAMSIRLAKEAGKEVFVYWPPNPDILDEIG